MTSYRDFLDYAEGFYQEARVSEKCGENRKAEKSLIASILFSWISVEAFVNGMLDGLTSMPTEAFSLHEKALLTEKTVEFLDSGHHAGTFRLSKRTQYRRIEDKILFLIAKFGMGTAPDKGGPLWQTFVEFKKKRDQLTHPRKIQDMSLTVADADAALETSKNIIRLLAGEVWRKHVDI
jgi:hypothetical protein